MVNHGDFSYNMPLGAQTGSTPHPFLLTEKFSKKNRPRSEIKQLQIKRHYIYQMLNIAINRFKWKGLPKEVHPYRLEEWLMRDGIALFAYNETAEMFTVSKVVLEGDLDIYGYPDKRRAWFINEPSKNYSKETSVLLQDKPILYPSYADIELYADTLSKMWMTRDLNLYAMRVPFIASGTEEQMIDFENMMQDYDKFVPFVKGSASLALQDNLQVFNTGVTPWLGEIASAQRQMKAEVMNLLGIEAVGINKKERVTEYEGESGVGETESCRNLFLDIRKRSAEQINDTFKELLEEEVSVEFNSDVGLLAEKFINGTIDSNINVGKTGNDNENTSFADGSSL